MSPFSYPVEYFSCKEFVTDDKNVDGMVNHFAKIGAAVGAVAGETGIDGLKIDFNNGVRVEVPEGNFHVIIGDHDSGKIYYDRDASEKIIVSLEKYYIRWEIIVLRDGEPVFSHVLDLRGQNVRLVLDVGGIGDQMSMIPYIKEFAGVHDCHVTYWTPGKFADICERLIPDVRPADLAHDDPPYATYELTAAFDFPGAAPHGSEMVPLESWGQVILGLNRVAPALKWTPREQVIKEPYVCISCQGSSVVKGWVREDGWREVTDYLLSLGYRVICIDKEKGQTVDGFTTAMPGNAEDFTGGDVSLAERADMLYHADFMIGLSSGLSWIAHEVGCPVIMIGGFSLFWHEFYNPYRVFNPMACHGCLNDSMKDFRELLCPRQRRGTDGVLECSRRISPKMVIRMIDQLLDDKKSGRLKDERK